MAMSGVKCTAFGALHVRLKISFTRVIHMIRASEYKRASEDSVTFGVIFPELI